MQRAKHVAEIDAIILGVGFGVWMEALFRSDLSASRVVDLAVWRWRDLGARVRELKAQLVEKLL